MFLKLILAALAVSFFLSTPSFAMEERPKVVAEPYFQVCRVNGLYVGIGELTFYFPPVFSNSMWFSRENVKADIPCYKYGDPLLVAHKASFTVVRFFPEYDRDQPLSQKGSSAFNGVLLEIDKIPFPSGEVQKEFYEDFDRASYQKMGDEYGFEVYMVDKPFKYLNNKTRLEKIYISKSLKTPQGLPLTFFCPMRYGTFTECETRTVYKDVSFHVMHIDTGHIPVQAWHTFYPKLWSLIESQIVRDDAHLKTLVESALKE